MHLSFPELTYITDQPINWKFKSLKYIPQSHERGWDKVVKKLVDRPGPNTTLPPSGWVNLGKSLTFLRPSSLCKMETKISSYRDIS